MTPLEQIIAFLRDHPDSTRAKISEVCGKQKMWALHWLRILLLDGNIGKRKISNNEVRYFLINEVLKTKPIPDYYKSAIRQSVEYEKFKSAVIPIIKNFPGRSAVFYAEMLGHALQPTVRRLQRMKQVGILVSDKRRRRFMKNPAALWWIAGSEPEDMSSVPVPYEQSYDYKKEQKETEVHPDKAMSSEDDKWLNEIRKTREQRRLERLRDENQQMPIPSYADFFRQQEGRS